jgi:hypothetical protein
MILRATHRTHFLGWLLCLPFVLMSLLPAAVMPMRTAGGTFELVLCTGDGPVTTVVDNGTGHDDLGAAQGCDWACGQTALALCAPLAMAPLQGQARPSFAPSLSTPVAFAQATGLPPATGPPALI